jgi:cephalosporin hydroxylase
MITIKAPSPAKVTSASDPVSSIEKTVDAFHNLYYHDAGESTWRDTNWLGHRIFKCPLDLWIYQEILWEVKPEVIVECGTCLGGSALWLATMCDLLQKGRVITIDIDPPDGKPLHPRLTYLQGSSTSDHIVERIRRSIRPGEKVMVILDSDHSKDHVLNEMRIYSKIVSVGSYLIVEDGDINGHPVYPDFGPGPMEAIDEFFRENRDYLIDTKREKFLLTFNPHGYLKRIR